MKRRLPRLSNLQFDEVERQAEKRGVDLRTCPTCKTRPEEPAPGVFVWPTDSTYRYMDEDHACDCEWQQSLRRHYLLAHIPIRYWTLAEMDYFGDPSALAAAKAYLDGWQGYKDQGIGMEFHSPKQGTGKTFLAAWIARQLVQRKESVYYIRFLSIMGLFDRPYEERKLEEDRLWYTPVLVLDEVGPAISGPQGQYFAMEFENLMRARVDDNRVTIMTTNMTPEKLDEHYPRTYSLLAAKQLRHEIDGHDVRREGEALMLDMHVAENGEARPIC